jgi:hypothetical protein
MLIHEQIQEYVLKLSASSQVKVLDLVEYLIAKAEREALVEENREWSEFSLAFAMRGMEDEESLYMLADLKDEFYGTRSVGL